MIRYALDNLGWYEFEGLVQSLLKHRLGMGVEAWGGSGDWGRDAFFRGDLRYPSNEISGGTFVFQCKFVEHANAAGARPEGAVRKAVDKEVERLKKRDAGGAIQHYILLTNSPLSPEARLAICGKLSGAVSSANVHIHDGNDLCAWLDDARDVVRSFPLLWSLRNVGDLLKQWVHSDILNRSKAALEEASEIAAVFVPTRCYARALDVVARHKFVVLEGPPEMGKTAIGRMISIAMVARGWEALECRGPSDVLAAHEKDRQQVFLADDFFGRTEYEPTSVTVWQSELPQILRLMNDSHWLILTSRAHLLNLAKHSLDVPGRHRSFPAPGEVVVNASDLDEMEKGRILYRHLKNANLNDAVRKGLRDCARSIVRDPHFTPERIRRLATETVPSIVSDSDGAFSAERALGRLTEILRNPTRQMEISFRKLSDSQKWLLFALVEDESRSPAINSASLEARYNKLCPISAQEPFAEVLSVMSDAFVKRRADAHLNWVHPSCRDLAIAELARSLAFRTRFLEVCDVSGLMLALSRGGGGRGDVHYPLLQGDSDWSLVEERCLSLAASDFRVILEHASFALLFDQQEFTKVEPNFPQALSLLATLWRKAIVDANRVGWTTDLLALYSKHRVCELTVEQPLLQTLWDRQVSAALEDALDESVVVWQRAGALADLMELRNAIEESGIGVDLLSDGRITGVFKEWARVVEDEMQCSYETPGLRSEREEMSSDYMVLAEAVGAASSASVGTPWSETLARGKRHFESRSEDLSPEGGAYDPDEDRDIDVGRGADLHDLFSDL